MNDPYELLLSSHDAAALAAALRSRKTGALRSPVADELASLLAEARVVAPEYLPADRAALGSTLTYREEPAGVVRIVTLAHPGEAARSVERLSVLSPAGLALIGRKRGAVVMSSLPKGWPFSVRLLDVAPPRREKEAA